jgi:hypothetical protein
MNAFLSSLSLSRPAVWLGLCLALVVGAGGLYAFAASTGESGRSSAAPKPDAQTAAAPDSAAPLGSCEPRALPSAPRAQGGAALRTSDAASDAAPDVQLMATGTDPGWRIEDEADLQGWTAVVKRAGSFYAQPVELELTAVHDPLVDHGTDEKSGQKVSVVDPDTLGGEVLVLVRGIPDLTPGAIPTSVFRTVPVAALQSPLILDGAYDPQVSYTITPNGNPATNLVLRRLEIPPETTAPDLTSDAHVTGRQELSRHIQFPSSESVRPFRRPVLLWAGDLDRDGAIDLLFDNTDTHYNVHRSMQLYLSSRAGDDALVRLAAGLRGLGC